MDYKYIEQLLEQYWRCETSLIEEEQLRSFFMMHKDIPAHLLKYSRITSYNVCYTKLLRYPEHTFPHRGH